MAKVSPMTKASLTTPSPKPANQGGHSGVNYAPANIQAKATPVKPMHKAVLFSAQPSGTKGSNKGAN